jgi:hypothetical protein
MNSECLISPHESPAGLQWDQGTVLYPAFKLWIPTVNSLQLAAESGAGTDTIDLD